MRSSRSPKLQDYPKMAQFSTNGLVCLEKHIDSCRKPIHTKPEDIDVVYEIQQCVRWIKVMDLKKVCLQFPDYLLPDSCEIATRLQNLLGQTVYVMGDSAYESCCVDYVTAQHVEADGIIHFGPRCFSKWIELLPCLCIYEKSCVNINQLEKEFAKKFKDGGERITVIVDTPFIHKLGEITEVLQKHADISVVSADSNNLKNIGGTTLYIGSNSRKLMNFHLIFKPKKLHYYAPEEHNPLIKDYERNNVIFKRRRFLIEKIKDSHTVGIIIGTLAIKNFIEVINRVKRLLKLSKKTYYIISVGRPNVSKLANFPEMDLYVLICCSMSDIYDSRDFYKPIVTPHDIEVALNINGEDSSFSYDFSLKEVNADIQEGELRCRINAPDVSLLTGTIRANEELENIDVSAGKQIALRNEGIVALNEHSAAGFLAARTFKGLEQNLGQTEVKLAEDGKKGIAQEYENECF